MKKQFRLHIGLGIIVWSLLSGGLLTNQATAALVTFNFTGTVDSIGSHLSGGPFSASQAVTGSYTFESTTSNTGSGFTGTYNGALNGPPEAVAAKAKELADVANKLLAVAAEQKPTAEQMEKLNAHMKTMQEFCPVMPAMQGATTALRDAFASLAKMASRPRTRRTPPVTASSRPRSSCTGR